MVSEDHRDGGGVMGNRGGRHKLRGPARIEPRTKNPADSPAVPTRGAEMTRGMETPAVESPERAAWPAGSVTNGVGNSVGYVPPPPPARTPQPNPPAARTNATGATRARPDPTPNLAPNRAPNRAKVRILFVCIGNSCRSQMAEGFARTYGGDVIAPASAGLNPATIVQPLTHQVMAERGIVIDEHFPKGLEIATREYFDVVVNMSGIPLQTSSRLLEWTVQDPIGQNETVYRNVAKQIESMVMRLIAEIRNESHSQPGADSREVRR